MKTPLHTRLHLTRHDLLILVMMFGGAGLTMIDVAIRPLQGPGWVFVAGIALFSLGTLGLLFHDPKELP